MENDPTQTVGAPRLEVLQIPELRISSASFSRIRDKEGRYALLVNINRAQTGDVSLAPIGGGISSSEGGRDKLKSILGIEESAFENDSDLRFKMTGAKANIYREWFLSKEGRETDPMRELGEELIEEEKILEREDEENLMQSQYSFAGFSSSVSETSRVGQEGQTTLRLLEVFDVDLGDELLEKLVAASKKPNASIRFVTEEEMSDRATHDGLRIGEIAKTLLDPQEKIEEFV